MFLPIGDTKRRDGFFPWEVFFILILNVGVFIYELKILMTYGEKGLSSFFKEWGCVPAAITGFNQPFEFKGILTSMFLHGGFLHLLGNLLFLWIFADNIEDVLGPILFPFFYLLCGIAGNVAQILVDPSSNIPCIGASGAISGIMGAYLILFPLNKIKTLFFLWFRPIFFNIPAFLYLGFWFVFQLFYGAMSFGFQETGGVAYAAHLGGFLTGSILIFFFPKRK